MGAQKTALASDDDYSERLDRHQAAAFLKVSVRTLERYAEDGHLHPVWVGSWRRYPQADLERFRRGEPAPPPSRTPQPSTRSAAYHRNKKRARESK